MRSITISHTMARMMTVLMARVSSASAAAVASVIAPFGVKCPEAYGRVVGLMICPAKGTPSPACHEPSGRNT